MRLMYVFDPRESEGYLFRAPEFIARLFCRLNGRYDYATTPEGY